MDTTKPSRLSSREKSSGNKP